MSVLDTLFDDPDAVAHLIKDRKWGAHFMHAELPLAVLECMHVEAIKSKQAQGKKVPLAWKWVISTMCNAGSYDLRCAAASLFVGEAPVLRGVLISCENDANSSLNAPRFPTMDGRLPQDLSAKFVERAASQGLEPSAGWHYVHVSLPGSACARLINSQTASYADYDVGMPIAALFALVAGLVRPAYLGATVIYYATDMTAYAKMTMESVQLKSGDNILSRACKLGADQTRVCMLLFHAAAGRALLSHLNNAAKRVRYK